MTSSPLLCVNEETMRGSSLYVPDALHIPMVHNDSVIDFEVYHLLVRNHLSVRKNSLDDIAAKVS